MIPFYSDHSTIDGAKFFSHVYCIFDTPLQSKIIWLQLRIDPIFLMTMFVIQIFFQYLQERFNCLDLGHLSYQQLEKWDRMIDDALRTVDITHKNISDCKRGRHKTRSRIRITLKFYFICNIGWVITRTFHIDCKWPNRRGNVNIPSESFLEYMEVDHFNIYFRLLQISSK